MVMEGKRRLRNRDREILGDYYPSHTECALEELCESFGTELGHAYLENINHLLLVRLSTPVVVYSKRLGPQMLQFQYTKFSIWDVDREHLRRVYEQCLTSKRRKKPVTQEEVSLYIWKQLSRGKEEELSDKDLAIAVIDPRAVKGMKFRRFPKEVYVAAFPAEEGETRKPFTIHEADRSVDYDNPATFFIRFSVTPNFFIHNCAELDQEKNQLYISWPSAEKESAENFKRVMQVHGKNLSPSSYHGFDKTFGISQDVPREATMAFIRSFVRQSLDGTIY